MIEAIALFGTGIIVLIVLHFFRRPEKPSRTRVVASQEELRAFLEELNGRPPLPPTGQQCSDRAQLSRVINGKRVTALATWYPQMGGYVGRCLVVTEGDCFNAYVWHDGEFPFENGTPRVVHHCMTEQFRTFADDVEKFQAVLSLTK